MTTPQNTDKDLLPRAGDAMLEKQLRALPQVEPSPELDAAILGKIEHALKLEAQQKTLAEPSQVEPIATAQRPRQHFFQGLEHKLKQFWFIPVGAMAMLLASVTLNQTQTWSEHTTSPSPAKEVAIATNSSVPSSAGTDKSTTVAMNETQDQATNTPANSTPPLKRDEIETRSVVDSKKMTSELALLFEKRSKERFASKEESKIAATKKLARLNEAEIAFAKPVEKPDQENSKPASVPPAPTVAEVKMSSTRPVLTADVQRVEVTGSSIKRVQVESSNAVQVVERNDRIEDKVSPKTELYAVKDLYEPNLKLTEETKGLAKVSPRETAAIIEAPRPAFATAKAAPAPAAPITPPLESYRELPHPVDVIRARLEQLISLGRTGDALQLWKDFKENYPEAGLAPDLRKKLEELERKHNTKKPY